MGEKVLLEQFPNGVLLTDPSFHTAWNKTWFITDSIIATAIIILAVILLVILKPKFDKKVYIIATAIIVFAFIFNFCCIKFNFYINESYILMIMLPISMIGLVISESRKIKEEEKKKAIIESGENNNE